MENKIQGTMNSMLKGNYNIGKHFGSDAKKQVLNDLMVKHGVTTSLDKMKVYKREAFLNDVKNSRMDYYGKKALLEHYGPQKTEVKTSNMPSVNNNKTSNEKAASRPVEVRKSSVLSMLGFGFGASNKNIRQSGIVANADNYNDNQHADNYNDVKSESMDLIKKIQS